MSLIPQQSSWRFCSWDPLRLSRSHSHPCSPLMLLRPTESSSRQRSASTRCRTNTSSSGSLPLLIRSFSFLISYFSLFALQTDRVMTLDSRISLPLSTDQYLFQIRGNKSLFPMWCKMWTKKGKQNSIVSEYTPLYITTWTNTSLKSLAVSAPVFFSDFSGLEMLLHLH